MGWIKRQVRQFACATGPVGVVSYAVENRALAPVSAKDGFYL